jgi:hypothetical protein
LNGSVYLLAFSINKTLSVVLALHLLSVIEGDAAHSIIVAFAVCFAAGRSITYEYSSTSWFHVYTLLRSSFAIETGQREDEV